MSSDNSGSSEACSDSIAAQQEEQQPTQSRNDDNHRVLPLCGTSLPPLPLPQRLPATEENDTFAEIIMNRALHDPPRWGWTAVGGIADVLSPQEVRYCDGLGRDGCLFSCVWCLLRVRADSHRLFLSFHQTLTHPYPLVSMNSDPGDIAHARLTKARPRD
jgi:hypothetical protein